MKNKLHSEYFPRDDDLEVSKEERGSTYRQDWGVDYSYTLTGTQGFGDYTHSWMEQLISFKTSGFT